MSKHNLITYAIYDIKKYLKFSNIELKHLIYSIIIAGFSFTFNKWGVVRFDIERGLANFFLATLFLFIFYFAHITVKKIIAIKMGYDAKYDWSFPGLIIMFILAFLSYGYIPLLLLGETKFKQNDRRRVGWFRFALRHKDIMIINILAFLFNYFIILLVLVPIFFYTKSHFVMMLIKYNLAIVFFAMLPVPKNDGLIFFYSSRNTYFAMLSFIIVFSLLVLAFNIFSLFLALIISLVLYRIASVELRL